MSDHAPNPAAARPQLLDPGEEVCRCRRLSCAQSLRCHGYHLGWWICYVLYPFILLFASLNLTMVFFFIQGSGVEEMMGNLSVFGLVFAGLFLLGWSWLYVWPRGDHLVLYERGLRVRLGWQRLHTSPAAIDRLFIGGQRPQLETLMAADALPGKPADWLQSLGSAALTLIMKDRTIHVFKDLLNQFEPADLQRFFLELLKRNPSLLANGPP